MIFWTPSRVEELIHLYNETPLTCAEIALELGCTRNAVIGKIHRLGETSPKKAAAKHLRQLANVNFLTARKPKPKIAPPAPKPAALPAPDLAAPQGGPERPASRFCQWIYGYVGQPDFAYCARPVGARPHKAGKRPVYCPGHADMAYADRPPRGPKARRPIAWT